MSQPVFSLRKWGMKLVSPFLSHILPPSVNCLGLLAVCPRAQGSLVYLFLTEPTLSLHNSRPPYTPTAQTVYFRGYAERVFLSEKSHLSVSLEAFCSCFSIFRDSIFHCLTSLSAHCICPKLKHRFHKGRSFVVLVYSHILGPNPCADYMALLNNSAQRRVLTWRTCISWLLLLGGAYTSLGGV